jgi:hypothetical protein
MKKWRVALNKKNKRREWVSNFLGFEVVPKWLCVLLGMLQYEWRKCNRKTTKTYKRNKNIEGCWIGQTIENWRRTFSSKSYCKTKGIIGRVGEVGQQTNLQHCATTISLLTSPLSFKCEKRKWFMEEISEVVRCAKGIEEMTIPLFERLWIKKIRR